MKKHMNLHLFLGLMLAFGACSAQAAHDEVAMDNEADATEITDATHIFAPVYHKVAPGETIQSVIKEFGMNRYQFDRWNTLPDGFKPGVNVVIKYKWYKRSEFDMRTLQDNTQHKPLSIVNAAGGSYQYHRVAAHETLFSLSAQYHVPVAQLKIWNNLTGNNIKINDNLIVGK
jgi:LysM repeat protein